MKYRLHVASDGVAVGELSFDAAEDNYEFQYARIWKDTPEAYYLAPAIPLTGIPNKRGSVRRYLENLLPEGRALEIAAVVNQVSKNNVFALTHALGKEPVGAFSFSPIGTRPRDAQSSNEPARRPISHEELSERIRDRDSIPFPVWDGKVRLSVAGYQDKLQVLVEGEQLSLADGALSSTHLLKPESRNPHMQHMVANEHFCMTLAAGLNQAVRGPLVVAAVSIRRTPEPILLIERFDRAVQWDTQTPRRALTVTRKHVIDGCQALDLPSTFKYERNLGSGKDARNIREGVSFERLFDLLGNEKTAPIIVTPALARAYFIRWAILQLLLGNSDAHGKNISFYVLPVGLMPAPLYDLVSVNAYGDKVEQDMAMAYGDAFLPAEVSAYALADFAHRTNTSRAQLAREITGMARNALRLAPELAASDVYLGSERDLVHQVANYICGQAKRLLALALELPKVNPKLFE